MKCAFVRCFSHWMYSRTVVARTEFASGIGIGSRWPVAVIVVVAQLTPLVHRWTRIHDGRGRRRTPLVLLIVAIGAFLVLRLVRILFFLDDSNLTADPTELRHDLLLHQIETHGENSHAEEHVNSGKNQFTSGTGIVLLLARHLECARTYCLFIFQFSEAKY